MGKIEGGVRWGALSVLVGVALVLFGVGDRATTEPLDLQVLPLHNDEAESGSACDGRGPSWHFVLAPNNGTFAFHSMSLMLAGVLHEFDGEHIVRNSGQLDNVFVAVPPGRTVDDLEADGSFAQVTPGSSTRRVVFVLSDVCPGGTATTTTVPATTSTVPSSTTSTTAPSTTTTVPESSTTTLPSSTTTVPGSTTTVPGSTTTSTTTSTTSTVPGSTTTVPGSTTTTTTSTTSTVPGSSTTTSTTSTSSTTTTTVQQQAPTTTSTTTTTVPTGSTTTSPTVSSTTTSVPGSSAPTGSGSARTLLLVGALFVILGATALLGAHVRATEPR